MYPVKKITKEDTWRSDDLKVHIQAHNEDSRRKSKREEEHRKHRNGESLDRRQRDPDQDARKEKEKRRHGESTREESKHRDPDRDRNQDIKREDVREDRYKERGRERDKALDFNRHGDGDEEEKRHDRGEKENSERRKDRDKDRDIDMYKQRDREMDREREKDRDRDRRRSERDRERKSETDRRKEEKREGGKEEKERDKERERERRERHRARESDRNRHEYEEKQREGERREKRSDKENFGHKEREHRRDREDREKRIRDKESHVPNASHSQEGERHHQERKESKDYFHGIKGGDREKAREREERDRRRERRHKEASDYKSERSERERKQKVSSGHEMNERIIKDKEEPTKRPQVENEDTEKDKQSGKDYHNDDYDEDFEDYEEDFEDVGEEEDDKGEEEKVEDDKKVREEKRELSPRRREEIEAIQRAIDEENDRIYSARSKPTNIESAITQRERHSNKSQMHGKIIDFVSAKQREVSQKVAKKQKKRSEELLRLIDLDFSITFSLLDLPPVNEYDMYIKTFGTADTKQAYVQCNEDNTDRDIQTEEVDMTDKWTQHPPEAKAACGGSKVSQDTSVESTARITTDSQHLTTFLRSAAQVMAVLIEENMAESNSVRKLRSQTDALSFSDGCIQLNAKLPFLHGRQVSLLQFSQVQRQTLLSVHPPPSKTSAVQLDSETVICVWNIWEPSRPQKILLYESEVRCCCFSPGKVTLVFAGTAVGSVVVWDLREHSGTHCNLVVGKEVWTLRYPTFSTDAVLSGVGHLSPVVSVEPVLATADTSSKITADIEESLGLSFQLGSLDENGVLTLWVVVELPKGNDSGSQTDLGLRPGGKVKLLHSSSLQTSERLPQDIIMGFGSPVSLQLKFLPSDSNHYFIGTNMGLVRHGTRHSLKVLPKFYRSQFDSCRPVEVTTLDFSPFGEPLFLVGCSDGTVRLHSVLREDPLMEWSECSSGAPVLSVQWSQTRPAVFCVLDAASDLLIWDPIIFCFSSFPMNILYPASVQMNHGNVLTHGLRHVLHLSCKDPVCHMTCGEGAAGFASLHCSSHVRFYYPDGHLKDLSFRQSLTIHYAGLTSTHLPGRLVGWGPGAILTVLDAELNPLVHAVEPMDVRVCKILEHSNELVTAGMGNVCVWCLTHLICRKRVVEGLGKHIVFTHLALVPSRTEQGLRALAAYGQAVVVVDLTKGCIVDHKKNLHSREITGMVYCPLRDIVVTASDMTIRVWGLDWELQMAFVGHTALVTSLVLCPVSGLLLSSSLDGTLRCWRPEVGDQIQSVSIPRGCLPPLFLGGPDSAGTFFSYSTNSVDFWTFNCLYNLHCRLDGFLEGPVRQILTTLSPPSFQACVVCIHGNSNITVVEAETGAVLTRFQANGRVRCADYCVPKERLLVLTEDGVVSIVSTLTSPVTILDEWHGIEHWDWPGGQVEANIGMVCCMVLYSDVIDTPSGQEEWRSLQMQRAQKPKKIKLLCDAKNRFLIILGHCGGCVSVLNMLSGKVQFRTSAHNNQNISSMQAHPNSGYLLTAGEDKALLVWRVFPCAQQCLSLHFSLLCDLPPILLALMGTQLTLALQDPENDTYSMVQYSLESQSRSDQQPNEEHHNKITGLCACYQLSVFASSSQDGTVRIWDMENRLLRILELNAEPECLAYCEGGDLLLGITGDLYRIPHTQLLPPDCRTQKCDPDSELPKSWIPIMSHKCRTESCHVAKKDGPERLDKIKDSDFGALVARHKDLESLQKGEVECRRRQPATIQTKQEAFNNYLRLIYRQPPDMRLIELDEVQLLYTKEEDEKGREEADIHLITIIETPSTKKSPLPPTTAAKKLREKIYPTLPPIKRPTPPPTPPSESAPLSPPPAPPFPPKQPTSLPPPPSSSYLPEFLLQFVDEQWFQKIFPDLSCVSSSFGPKEFCMHLLDFMMFCSMAQKNSIVNALLMLIQQEVLDKESLSRGLLVCLQNCINENMTREEQHFAGELLNLMVYLSPDSFDTIVELLAMLADKQVDLKALVLCILQKLGVEDAELWLCPELDSWDSLREHQHNQHCVLRDMASHWLLSWTRKYRVHKGSVFLRSEGVQSVFTPVEVLQYFCSMQRGKQPRPPPPPPEGRKDVVIVPSGLTRLKPIQRLGETYSMSRIREPQGRLLPPLPYRPVLMGFTRFLSLPMAHVTLSPFPFSLDFQNFKRPSPHRYFFLERSYVEYYR